MPSRQFHGLWESLVFDTQIKLRLLQYASSALLFADRHVNNQLISWNRVVLLHGPPGTGKTSLCKALAQKLSIHFGGRYCLSVILEHVYTKSRIRHDRGPIAVCLLRYSQGQLIEVNAHSLFSKWFSESGKLVSRLFAKIQVGQMPTTTQNSFGFLVKYARVHTILHKLYVRSHISATLSYRR